MPAGRPSEFTQEKADVICAAVAEGHSLRKIAKLDGMPKPSTVCDWIRLRPEFSEQYARAKMAQAELLADEIFDLSDDDTKDVSGELDMPNGVAVQRSRLMVDTRKWYLSKVLPKIYGDKVEHTGSNGGPVEFVVKSILEDK